MVKSRYGIGDALIALIGAAFAVIVIAAIVIVAIALSPSTTTTGTVSSFSTTNGYTLIQFISNAGGVACDNNNVPQSLHIGEVLRVYQPGGFNSNVCQITVLAQ